MIFKDRVKQYTNTIGTDDYSLHGSFGGYETFADSFSDGDVTSCCVTDGSSYEVFFPTVSASGLTLSRDTISSSSNAGNKVVWSAGNKIVFCTLAAPLVTSYGNGDPASDRNPAYSGAQYINLLDGTLWSCTDNTVDNNVWVAVAGVSSSTVEALAVALVIALA